MSRESLPNSLILGIDPGSVVTGYGLILKSGHQLQILDYGTIRPPRTALLTDRYLILHESTHSLIEKHKPTALSVESQYVSKNIQSALKLGMARAAIMLAAKREGIPVFAYTPTKAKLAVTGVGSASKEQIERMIQKLLNVSKAIPHDAADALALAICHAHAAFPEEI